MAEVTGDTRGRVLEAAGEVFADLGYRTTTVRDICARAGVNIAAVNYYFGSKEELYRAALEHSYVCAGRLPGEGSGEGPAEARLGAFVRAALDRMLNAGRPAWQSKLMAREMAEPSGLMGPLCERYMRPQFELLKGIIRELSPAGVGDEGRVELLAMSTMGQCVFYKTSGHVIEQVSGRGATAGHSVDELARHIAGVIVAAARSGGGGWRVNFVALRMLMGDAAKYYGIIFGLTFASLLITLQLGIFVGLMTRTYGFISDTQLPDVWVMDPKVQFVDDIKPLQETRLLRVRGVDGVQWAVPMYKGLIQARLETGDTQTCNVIGIDDATLVGGPAKMVEGTLADLRRSEGVIIDTVGAQDKLAKTAVGADGRPDPTAKKVPLKVGDTIELNDRRAVVVGICEVQRTFQSNPVVYTTYLRALQYAPSQRKLLSFVIAKAKPGVDIGELCDRIHRVTGLDALTRDQFAKRTYIYFMKYTGIPINFGIAVALGFIVGTAIAGQTFYNFTLDNVRHFGALKAMGAGNPVLLRMILLQAVTVGAIGYGLGVGAASFIGRMASKGELAFFLPWQLLAITAGAIGVICIASALLSISKVVRLEPAIVFKG